MSLRSRADWHNRGQSRAWRGRRACLWSLALLAVLLVGCTEEVTGPSPTIEDPAVGQETLPLTPGVVCRDQLITDVVITGKNFSPTPIDIPNDPRTALPTLTLTRNMGIDGSASDALEVVYNGDPDNPSNLMLLTWQDQEHMTMTVVPPCSADTDCGEGYICHPEAGVCAHSAEDEVTGPLEEGIYDIKVQNPNTNNAESIGAIAVLERPTFVGITPTLTCLNQGPRDVVLAGTRFLTIDSAQAKVAVEGFGAPFDVNEGTFTDCTAIPHTGYGGVEICDGATITLPETADSVGYPSLMVQNPETAACHTEEAINIRVVPPPQVNAVLALEEDGSAVADGDGTIICLSEGPRDVIFYGQDFLEVDGVFPTVTIEGTSVTVKAVGVCETLETMGMEVQKCSELTVEIPASLAATDSTYQPTIIIENPAPAGCTDDTSTGRLNLLTVALPPDLIEIQPPLICIEDGDREVILMGSEFLSIDSVPPEVLFEGILVPVENIVPRSCEALDVGGRTVERCTELVVTIAQDSLPLGNPSVTVTNPAPAGCSDTVADILTIVEGPEIATATPSLVCTDDGDRQVALSGTGILTIDTVLPVVTMDGVPVTVDGVAGCQNILVNGLDTLQCDTINITIPQGSLSEGNTEVVLENPSPANCSISSTTVLTVPPAISVVSVDPSSVCISNLGTVNMTITGTGFLTVEGVPFVLEINGATATPDSVADCTPLDVAGLTVESCNTITVSFDTTGLSLGNIPITITNPDPSGCGTTTTDVFQVAPPPTISAVNPLEICSDVEETITLTGTGFISTSTVTANTTPASSVTFINDTELQVSFSNGLPAGLYDLTVDNGEGCESTITSGLTVNLTPIVFFVDPPVIYNGISIEGTIFTSGLDATADTVTVIDSAGVATDIPDYSSDPARPNRTLATIPAGLPADTYEVSVTSIQGCTSAINGSVIITDTTTLALEGINPAFASPTVSTAVTINATDPVPGGEVQFSSTPRVYLNPSSSTGTATASAMRAVVFSDATRLTGIIPGGLVPGDYDLIVVNPGGEVGVLTSAVTVGGVEPPLVTSVAPSSIDAGSITPITIGGDFFDLSGATVDVTCEATDGSVSVISATGVTVADTNTITATLDGAGVAAGAVCLVTVTNGDGASFDFSAISFKNSSQNLNPWSESANTLVEARRAPSLIAGRPTLISRYLFAIGGDEGDASTAKTSVEGSNVDVFGNLDAWELQRNSLPEARTLASITRIGEFIYMTGGHNGVNAVNTTYRTEVLDPLAGPEILDLDAALGDGTLGLEGGLWYYRVAATFPADDVNNPNGESLPGEVLTVQLPDITDKITLTLNWAEVPGADGYRVYRSSVVDDSADNVELLAVVSGGTSLTLIDDGQTATTPEFPLPPGSLGQWAALATSPMLSARESHSTLSFENPNNPDEWYIYSFGGRDENGTILDNYEYATITLNTDGTQSVSAWTMGTKDLGGPRAEMGAWIISNSDTTLIGTDEVYVFIGSGTTNGSDTTGQVRSARIDASSTSGDLISADGASFDLDPKNINSARRAPGYGDASGFIFLFGGFASNGGTQSTDASASIEPGLITSNWNSLGGGSVVVQRAYPGSTQESAFFFLVGGQTDLDAATNSVEQTVQ